MAYRQLLNAPTDSMTPSLRGTLDSDSVADYFRMKQDAGVGAPQLKGELGAARAPPGKEGILLHNFMVRSCAASNLLNLRCWLV